MPAMDRDQKQVDAVVDKEKRRGGDSCSNEGVSQQLRLEQMAEIKMKLNLQGFAVGDGAKS